jgi:hypothetical protein
MDKFTTFDNEKVLHATKNGMYALVEVDSGITGNRMFVAVFDRFFTHYPFVDDTKGKVISYDNPYRFPLYIRKRWTQVLRRYLKRPDILMPD